MISLIVKVARFFFWIVKIQNKNLNKNGNSVNTEASDFEVNKFRGFFNLMNLTSSCCVVSFIPGHFVTTDPWHLLCTTHVQTENVRKIIFSI